MTYMKKPSIRHPALRQNDLGLTRRDYEGVISTLCAGCGHDSVTAAIVEACFELSLPAHRLAKLSGIGCSSKTTNYFLNLSHGFNSVHGRMPAIATGANLANRDLVYLGVSGDGDTASIGLGQFCHAVRRQLNMVYIVENNGTYGLTKGQFSATSDRESRSKKGKDNLFEAIDLCVMAIQLGAGFVARGFSGDRAQLVPLMKAAIAYEGFALIDVISPCVTFNNHVASTKSYDYIRDHSEAVGDLDFVPAKSDIEVDYAEGETATITLHDGSVMALSKLADNYDPRDGHGAIDNIRRQYEAGNVVTGLLYVREDVDDLHARLRTTATPLNELTQDQVCPGRTALDAINESLR